MKAPQVLSELLFAVFLLLFGVSYFIEFPFAGLLLALLALAVGVLKFLGK